MDKRELEERTKRFALRVIKFVAALPKNTITNVMGYQLLKAGTSIGANYREANRAVSRNDFINKIRNPKSRTRIPRMHGFLLTN